MGRGDDDQLAAYDVSVGEAGLRPEEDGQADGRSGLRGFVRRRECSWAWPEWKRPRRSLHTTKDRPED
jgi:hypothetical protein